MKAIKDANGFVLSWNRRKSSRLSRAVFIKYKDIIRSQPINIIDVSSALFNAMTAIEKLEKVGDTTHQLVYLKNNWVKKLK